MNGDVGERALARVNLIVAKENMQNDKFLIALFEGRNIFVLIFFGGMMNVSFVRISRLEVIN